MHYEIVDLKKQPVFPGRTYALRDTAIEAARKVSAPKPGSGKYPTVNGIACMVVRVEDDKTRTTCGFACDGRWSYAKDCGYCHGAGKVRVYQVGGYQNAECMSCDGCGAKPEEDEFFDVKTTPHMFTKEKFREVSYGGHAYKIPVRNIAGTRLWTSDEGVTVYQSADGRVFVKP